MGLNDENEVQIGDSQYVTVTNMGHILEVQHMTKKNTTCHIRKLDADRYIQLETGEICEFNKSANRSDNTNSLRQTFKKIRYYINNNFVGNPNELFLTLTYAENMTDPARLYKDFKNFMDRLRTKLKVKASDLDYFSVVEPQERGAWHMHVLLRFNDRDSAFLPWQMVKPVWGHGNIMIEQLNEVDNIGAYLTAYLSDHPVPDDFQPVSNQTEVVVKEKDGIKKKFIKGGRLHLYPPGMNLYRKSKGIVYPEREEMTYKRAKKIVGSAEPHFKKSYKIETENFQNTITYEQYNLKRH